MTLDKLIPDNDSNWIIKNNMIYYHHYCDIPLLQKRGDKFWIILDHRITKRALKLVRHLDRLNIDFYFNSKALNSNQDLTTDESKAEIIRNYLYSLRVVSFFDGIHKIDFDYISNLTQYIIENNCWEIFKDEFEIAKKNAWRKSWDYYANTQLFDVKREDIREFISGLERQIKLNLFL